MKLLKYSDSENSFSSRVHLIITRKPDYIKDTADLIAVGMIDVDSSARGIVARISRGDQTTLWSEPVRGHFEQKILSEKHMYRFVNRPVGKLTHCLVIHKNAVDETIGKEQSRILLVPTGADEREIFLRRFASDFNMPYVTEWKDAIWDECNRLGYAHTLHVWTDPKVEMWRDIQAFEMDSSLNEESAKSVVSRLLSSRSLLLPEGTTDAPAIDEALQPDEEGNIAVIDYLQTFAPHLAVTIEDSARPVHDLDRPIHPAIAQMKRIPFPAQAHLIQAVVSGYQGHGVLNKDVWCPSNKAAFIVADMGTGKTIQALGVSNVLAEESKKGFTALLLVPGITIPKWAKEIRETIPHAKITVFENWHDVVAYRENVVKKRKKAHIEFILLSRDTSKLGMPKIPSLIYKEKWVIPNKAKWNDSYSSAALIEDVWLCPDCGGIQTKDTQEAEKRAKKKDYEVEQMIERKLGFKDLSTRKDGNIKFRDSVTEYHCSSCGHNLMRYMVPERETVPGLRKRRLHPAWFISHYMSGWVDLLVADELHMYKNSSGQGESLGLLVQSSRKFLGLTGTLTDGKSSSLYYVLFRTSPQQMKQDGMDNKSLNKWVNRYGATESKTRYLADDVKAAGGSTSRRVVKNPPREIPGLSPKLFTSHLLNKSVFMELGDIGLPLVELEERPIFVDMDEGHERHYLAFHNELEATMRQQYAIGNKAAFARFIPSVVNAANLPHRDIYVPLGDEGVHFEAPNDELTLSAKERRILSDVQAELAQNRRCVVYVRYSGEAAQDKRIADILVKAGIKARVLEASVSPEDRMDWLDKSVRDNVEVVVTNCKLVEVGLDLIDYPTLMFLQFTDEVTTMRQAARRSWRLLQHRACKVFYYVYNKSYEVVQFKRTMRKRCHSMLLEGRIEKSGVAQFMELDDKSSSTFNIAACLGDVSDLSKRWADLADKDIPAGVILLKEEEFKKEIVLAMKRLSAETCRLAGVPVPVEEPEVPTHAESPTVVVIGEKAKGDKHVSALPLFDLTVSAVDDQVNISDLPTAQVVTVGMARQQMGLVTKAKRVKVHEDQIMLAL